MEEYRGWLAGTLTQKPCNPTWRSHCVRAPLSAPVPRSGGSSSPSWVNVPSIAELIDSLHWLSVPSPWWWLLLLQGETLRRHSGRPPGRWAAAPRAGELIGPTSLRRSRTFTCGGAAWKGLQTARPPTPPAPPRRHVAPPHRVPLTSLPEGGRSAEPVLPGESRARRGTMSWIPFKIGQPKKQIVPKTVERDFEREYGKLQQLEDQTKKLQKDMKKSTDADLAMSKSAVKISSDLLSNPLCEQDPKFLEMVMALDTAMKRMDSFNQEKVNQIQKTVIEPLKKFSGVFPSLNMAVKRREQALQDYKRLQSKVEKYEEKEKTGPILAKLHQARDELRPVKEDFEAKNKQLLEEMPKFHSSRVDYFQPSFESLIRAQVVYYTEMYKIFGDLTEQIDEPGLTDEQREKENEAKLNELRALSIVADD